MVSPAIDELFSFLFKLSVKDIPYNCICSCSVAM